VGWRRVEGGYTAAERWVVQLSDATSRFVKIAAGGRTAAWLRAEYRVYSQLDAAFLPQLYGWNDDGRLPILVLEDLSRAHWPPPWQPGQVESVLRALARVHATRLPLQKFDEEHTDVLGAWERVGKDPLPFLSAGLCSRAWLTQALPALSETARKAPIEGEELVHFDVRSDNICFAGARTVLVDWNWAARGNGLLDLAFWAPSLHAEGGPRPEEILPDSGVWAALVSGFFAERVGQTAVRNADAIRAVQLKQLRVALPWAARALGLPPLDE